MIDGAMAGVEGEGAPRGPSEAVWPRVPRPLPALPCSGSLSLESVSLSPSRAMGLSPRLRQPEPQAVGPHPPACPLNGPNPNSSPPASRASSPSCFWRPLQVQRRAVGGHSFASRFPNAWSPFPAPSSNNVQSYRLGPYCPTPNHLQVSLWPSACW